MGELLVRIGLISEAQLDSALGAQAERGGKIGEVLVRDLVVTEDQIAEALAQQKGLRHVNLAAYDIDKAAVLLLPWRMARLRGVIPIGFNDGRLVLAMSDPLDVEAVDETEIRTGYKVDPVVASASQVLYAIEKYAVASDTIQQLEQSQGGDFEEEEHFEATGSDGDVPIVRVVNQLIREAVGDRASDIHFEPGVDGVRVRFRVDGVLAGRGCAPQELATRSDQPHQGHGGHGHHRAPSSAGRADRIADRKDRGRLASRHAAHAAWRRLSPCAF